MKIYLDVLKSLVEEKEYTLYIHPPVPVIDVTRYPNLHSTSLRYRHIVKTFNGVLKEEIRRLQHPSIHYLDFFEKMLTDDGEKLLPDYELDGTHMNSRYLPHIETALADVLEK